MEKVFPSHVFLNYLRDEGIGQIETTGPQTGVPYFHGIWGPNFGDLISTGQWKGRGRDLQTSKWSCMWQHTTVWRRQRVMKGL